MASLAGREHLAGQVQMIYFDPPYGMSYKSNFQVAVDDLGTSENRKGLPSDPQTIAAFRDTYEHGIHSYLDGMHERLVLCRELLAETGSIFVQIGDENVLRIGLLLDEVFGAENRVALIPYATSGGSSANTLPSVADFLLWYAKDRGQVKYRQLYESLDRAGKIELMSSYAMVELADGTARGLGAEEKGCPRRTPARGGSRVSADGAEFTGDIDDGALRALSLERPRLAVPVGRALAGVDGWHGSPGCAGPPGCRRTGLIAVLEAL